MSGDASDSSAGRAEESAPTGPTGPAGLRFRSPRVAMKQTDLAFTPVIGRPHGCRGGLAIMVAVNDRLAGEPGRSDREVGIGDAVRVAGRPLHQFDPVALRVGEPASP